MNSLNNLAPAKPVTTGAKPDPVPSCPLFDGGLRMWPAACPGGSGKDPMKQPFVLQGLATITLLGAGLLATPPAVAAADYDDSPEISRLLADTRAEAVELTREASDLEAFTKSKLSWSTYADKVEMMRGHVNNSGKMLTKLQEAQDSGSPWQRTAISRIEPLLKELAANTEAIIAFMTENKTLIHFPEFRNYAKANYDLASDFEALVRDYVNYGEAREKIDQLSRKLETTN